MASPTVKVNTFFKKKRKPFIDPLSKFYIVAASLLGLNRLPIILNEAKGIFTSLAVVYSVILITAIYYTAYVCDTYVQIISIMSAIEYTFGFMFSFITWKRMNRYYHELNKFDSEIGCRPKLTAQSVKNLILMILTNVFFTSSVWIAHTWKEGQPCFVHTLPPNLVYCVELFYYGHLLSLLHPRLHLINYYVETALSNGKAATCPKVDELISFKTKCDKNADLKKLMDLYYVMIRAYDFLVAAIKWQLLVIIITSFIATLTFCYYLARDLIREERVTINILTNLDMMVMKMVSLFSPCVFSDRVHGEVRRLRELLASRLYENKLDKVGRSAARSLLALTEARELSFSLLRMLQIDISFPFKFIGLLVTYLIILLQFEKVINPSTTTHNVT